MRKRRRSRVSWFIPVGQLATQQTTFFDSPGPIHLRLASEAFEDGDNNVARGNSEVIFDFNKINDFVDAATLPSLADLVGSAYFLKRIVGKCHACVGAGFQEGSITPPPAVLLTAAFIINRTGDSDLPLAALSEAVPSLTVSMTDPWIWRRSWVLQVPHHAVSNDSIGIETAWNPWIPPQETQAAIPYVPPWNNNNWTGRAVADGPHIDQKTKRYVGPEERLFFWADAWALPLPEGAVSSFSPWTVDIQLDVRVLGTLLKGSNKRNASR